jgi:hypothetical protein
MNEDWRVPKAGYPQVMPAPTTKAQAKAALLQHLASNVLLVAPVESKETGTTQVAKIASSAGRCCST